jgi:hypothetical protein
MCGEISPPTQKTASKAEVIALRAEGDSSPMILAADEIAAELDEIKTSLAILDWSVVCMPPELVGGPRWRILLSKQTEFTARLAELRRQSWPTPGLGVLSGVTFPSLPS